MRRLKRLLDIPLGILGWTGGLPPLWFFGLEAVGFLAFWGLLGSLPLGLSFWPSLDVDGVSGLGRLVGGLFWAPVGVESSLPDSVMNR